MQSSDHIGVVNRDGTVHHCSRTTNKSTDNTASKPALQNAPIHITDGETGEWNESRDLKKRQVRYYILLPIAVSLLMSP